MARTERKLLITLGRRRTGIPSFNSVEEEATFWETHDLTELEDDLELVRDVQFVKGKLGRGITVRLDEETLDAIAKRALQEGIGASTLARIWILDRLRSERKRSPSRSVR